MPRLIRSAVLNNFVEVARSVGLDPYHMITEFHLPAACLKRLRNQDFGTQGRAPVRSSSGALREDRFRLAARRPANTLKFGRTGAAGPQTTDNSQGT